MSKQKKTEPKANTNDYQYMYCELPRVTERIFAPDMNPDRVDLILINGKKWVNGTVLHYYFFDQPTDGETVFLSDGTSEWQTWVGEGAEQDIVREAFKIWKNIGIGLEFKEVDSRSEAEIRIGFMRGNGAWSYVGRDNLKIGINKRTMNFGWDLTNPGEVDTALHEIGHAIGFSHEHQNPHAGIEWDEEAVYAALAKPPNNWTREKTFHNIIRKIEPDDVQGSNWDPNSIMHYPFRATLIDAPEPYSKEGIDPIAGLSDRDKVWARTFYKPLKPTDYQKLQVLGSTKLAIAEGEQGNFIIEPDATRNYNIQIFGEADAVMVLFEEVDGTLRYVAGDDDSGTNSNATINWKLFKGRRYVVRIRLFFQDRNDETAVMLW